MCWGKINLEETEMPTEPAVLNPIVKRSKTLRSVRRRSPPIVVFVAPSNSAI
jgi:hypothetical protein